MYFYSLMPLHSFAFFLCLVNICFCLEAKLNMSSSLAGRGRRTRWSSGGATWYGGANGDGSDGGACGYGTAVGNFPFKSMIAAGSPSVFRAGKGCGACYQVRCARNRACSHNPVTVVVTDECPGGPCLTESVHFDLSGSAFGAMALHGRGDKLRATGVQPIQYRRVPCKYPHATVTFHVDVGSNPNYLAVLIEFTDGDGSIESVELKESKYNPTWRPMRESWGAVWKLDAGGQLKAPISIRVTAQHSHKKLLAKNVIPAGWKPGVTYRSLVNFN